VLGRLPFLEDRAGGGDDIAKVLGFIVLQGPIFRRLGEAEIGALPTEVAVRDKARARSDHVTVLGGLVLEGDGVLVSAIKEGVLLLDFVHLLLNDVCPRAVLRRAPSFRHLERLIVVLFEGTLLPDV